MPTQHFNTAMRESFIRAAIRSNICNDGHERIVKRIATTNNGVVYENKGWSAKLSYRTHATLVAKGIM